MTITFCGHRNFSESNKVKSQLMNILEKEINGKPVTFLLGGYGNFDSLAWLCCKEYQKKHNNAELFIVLAYYYPDKPDNYKYLESAYDKIIYPPIENIPYPYKISARNKWMVKSSDLLIAYAKFNYGGAYKSIQIAKTSKIRYINLAEFA